MTNGVPKNVFYVHNQDTQSYLKQSGTRFRQAHQKEEQERSSPRQRWQSAYRTQPKDKPFNRPAGGIRAGRGSDVPGRG